MMASDAWTRRGFLAGLLTVPVGMTSDHPAWVQKRTYHLKLDAG
jgi:hypothetical protein